MIYLILLSQFEEYNLSREILLPKYDLPDNFKSQIEYLRNLCTKGAEQKYKVVSEDIKKRIDFELDTIDKTWISGLFLIVQDIIKHARSMGVSWGLVGAQLVDL